MCKAINALFNSPAGHLRAGENRKSAKGGLKCREWFKTGRKPAFDAFGVTLFLARAAMMPASEQGAPPRGAGAGGSAAGARNLIFLRRFDERASSRWKRFGPKGLPSKEPFLVSCPEAWLRACSPIRPGDLCREG